MQNIILEIEGTEYKLKLDWTIQEYLDCFIPDYKLTYQDLLKDETKWDELIHKAVNIPLDVLEKCNPEHKTYVIIMLDNIKLFDSNIRTIDMKQMTFGNFVDLDVYFFNNPLKYWREILDILTPKADKDSLYINDLMKVFNLFLEFRLWLYKQYKGLFGWSEKTDRDEDGLLSPNNITEIAGAWFNVICVLSNEDINKIDETTKQPILKVLNFLARKKDKENKEMREMRKNKLTK
jgi:hypothetical protein